MGEPPCTVSRSLGGYQVWAPLASRPRASCGSSVSLAACSSLLQDEVFCHFSVHGIWDPGCHQRQGRLFNSPLQAHASEQACAGGLSEMPALHRWWRALLLSRLAWRCAERCNLCSLHCTDGGVPFYCPGLPGGARSAATCAACIVQMVACLSIVQACLEVRGALQLVQPHAKTLNCELAMIMR